MNQAAFNNTFNFDSLPNISLSHYFRNAGDMLNDESVLLGHVINSILSAGANLTNKSIIAKLVDILESTDDVVTCDIARKTLEIVLDHTVDDI